MKVCILQSVLDPFKGGNHLPLFGAMDDAEFVIVCNRSKALPEDLPANVSVVTVPGRIGPYYYGVADVLFARAVMRQYPAASDFWKQFDVIHLNQVMGPAFAALKRTGIPLAFLIHHPVTADRHVSGWRLKYALLCSMQKRMCGIADRIVTVSHTMQQRIASDYACSEDKISVVPNGVDGSCFPLTPDDDCTADAAAVGSFVHPRKGFGYLLEVYRELSRHGMCIVDVGRRSDAQRAALTTIPGVTVYGTVSQAELVERMRRSRVLVSTSQFEGFGLSLIEALACGHPAFAFAVGAVPEVLEPIDPNLIVPPGDTAELSKRIRAYLERPASERDRLGREYRAAVLERYPLSKSASSLKSVYEGLAS